MKTKSNHLRLFVIIFMVLLCTPKAKNQAFVEIFTNTLTSEYYVTKDLCDSLELLHANIHVHSQDIYTTIQGKKRWYNRGTGNIPEAFVNGYKMSDITDNAEMVRLVKQHPLIGEISVQGEFELKPNLDVLVTWKLDCTLPNGILRTYIVEDIKCGNWPEPTNVMRLIIDPDGFPVTPNIWRSMIWNPEWVFENCSVIFVVENKFGKVTACKEMTLRKSITTSTNPIPIKKMEMLIYPNPAERYIDVACEEPIHSIEIFNIKGQKMDPPLLEGNRVDLTGLLKGTYILVINRNNSKVFIKR